MKKYNGKVFISKSNDPYRNLAIEEMLLHCVQPNEVILYLWQNENTVVIGRNQNAWRECNLEAFQSQHGRLARRLSGGGAVYHDMGNQNFTFITQDNLYDVAKQSDVICLAARKFGIKAIRNGRNDIVAEERKFSGNAFYSGKGVSYHHGTILISSNMSKLGEFLTPSKEKLQAKGVSSVRSRVINLCELAPAITPEKMRKALIISFEEIYGSKVQYMEDTILDETELKKLTKHYQSKEWTLGRLSHFDRQFHTKLSFGEVEVQISVSQGVIQDVMIYSDTLNTAWVERMTQKLSGTNFDTASIKNALSHVNTDEKETNEFLDYLILHI